MLKNIKQCNNKILFINSQINFYLQQFFTLKIDKLTEQEEYILSVNEYSKLIPDQENNKPLLGLTLSVSGGVKNLINQLAQYNADACSYFITSNRQWNAVLPSKQQIEEFQQLFKENQVELKISNSSFLCHAPYLVNLCSENLEVKQKSEKRFLIDSFITRQYGMKLMNFHPGSCENKQKGIQIVAQNCNRVFKIIPDLILILETMPGEKKVCNSFKECKQVIDLIEDQYKNRIGVCIDTQHCWAGGFVDRKNYGQQLIEQFDKQVGIQYLKGIHMNGSLKDFGSQVDRHANFTDKNNIIPLKELKQVIIELKQRKLNIPVAIETPDEQLWKSEVKLMQKWLNDN